MFAFCELAGEAGDIAWRDAESVHAGVHLQMEGNSFAGFFRAFFGDDAGGSVIELGELLRTMDYCREIVLDETVFFAGPETCQNENRVLNAGFADGDAFFGASDAEPIRAGFFEGFGDFGAAVAVTIAFDDAENLARSLALLSGRIHEFADGAEIFRQGAQRDFGPDGAAPEIWGTVIGS